MTLTITSCVPIYVSVTKHSHIWHCKVKNEKKKKIFRCFKEAGSRRSHFCVYKLLEHLTVIEGLKMLQWVLHRWCCGFKVNLHQKAFWRSSMHICETLIETYEPRVNCSQYVCALSGKLMFCFKWADLASPICTQLECYTTTAACIGEDKQAALNQFIMQKQSLKESFSPRVLLSFDHSTNVANWTADNSF